MSLGSLTGFKAPAAAFKTNFINVDKVDNNYSMDVWLYADDSFSTWAKGVDDSSKTPTENEKEFVDQYSNYTLVIACNVKLITKFDKETNRAESGCCLRDKSQKGGGYCVKLDAN